MRTHWYRPYNSGRRKRAYQYTAFVLWEGINTADHTTSVWKTVSVHFSQPLTERSWGTKATEALSS
jgi:hypothetical protein